MDNAYIKMGNEYAEFFKEEYKPMVDYFGVETTIKICEFYGGCQVYIPTKKSLFMKPMEQYILDNFHKYEPIELCRKFSISNRKLNRIIKDNLS